MFKVIRYRVPILIGIEALIIILLASLPTREWMNLLVALFMAILAYLLQIMLHGVVLHHFDKRRGFLSQSFWKKLAIGALLGIGVSVRPKPLGQPESHGARAARFYGRTRARQYADAAFVEAAPQAGPGCRHSALGRDT